MEITFYCMEFIRKQTEISHHVRTNERYTLFDIQKFYAVEIVTIFLLLSLEIMKVIISN